MIDRLHDILPYLEHLPPEVQEEAADYIEALAETFERRGINRGHFPSSRRVRPIERWDDPAGAWHDLPDNMLEDLDQLRHATPPTPPLDYL